MKRVITFIASGMTSAAFSAILAMPDRPARPDTASADAAPEKARAGVAAAPARTGGGSCYSWGNRTSVRLDLEVSDGDYGVAYDSPALWVKRGSPCHDINVRRPHNLGGPAAGQQVCTLVKVLIDGYEVTGWVDTCGGWQVLARLVAEGEPFVLRAAIRPIEITVAS